MPIEDPLVSLYKISAFVPFFANIYFNHYLERKEEKKVFEEEKEDRDHQIKIINSSIPFLNKTPWLIRDKNSGISIVLYASELNNY